MMNYLVGCVDVHRSQMILLIGLLFILPQYCRANVEMKSLQFYGSPNVQHGIDASFSCITLGDPPPIITWKIGEENVFQGISVVISPVPGDNNHVNNTLTFKPICADHGKNITCTASQSPLALAKAELLTVTAEAGTGTNCDITVSAPGSVSINPSSLNVNVGNPISVTCVTGSTGVTYAWRYNGTLIGSAANLFIPSATHSNDGLYTCTVTNSGGSNSATIDINVWSPVPTVSITPSLLSVSTGDSFSLNCETNALGVTYQWIHNGITIGTTSTITIQSAAGSSGGEYTCNVTNSGGSNSASINVNVLPTSSTQDTFTVSISPPSTNEPVSAQEQFNVSISAATLDVTVPQAITVTCLTDTSGATYQWLHNNVTIATTSVLSIQSTSRFDDGLYTCIVRNSVGTNHATIDINVLYAPIVTRDTVNISSPEGSVETLHCENEANPLATGYVWSVSGTSYTGNSSTFIVVIGCSEYTVQCQAVNSVGMSRTANFNIKPVLAGQPSVSVSPSALNVTEGDTITLSCDSPSSGVTYEWINESTIIGSQTPLVIQSASRFDNGVYTCRVTNSRGSNSATVNVNVWYAPVLKNSVISKVDSVGATMTLSCENDANPPATAYKWIYNGKSYIGESPTFAVVVGSTEYSVQCQATNGIGSSGSAVFNVTGLIDASDPSASGLVLESSLGNIEIAAIVMGIILLIFILIILLICCCCCGACARCRRKDKIQPEKENDEKGAKLYGNDVVYVFNIPKFYEDPYWKMRENDYDMKPNYHLLSTEEDKSGPIISLYDDMKHTPAAFHLSNKKEITDSDRRYSDRRQTYE